MTADSTSRTGSSTPPHSAHDGAATPVNDAPVVYSSAQKDSTIAAHDGPTLSSDNDGPLNKSITESSGKAEPENAPDAEGDLEGGKKPVHVVDESKLLHGSALL